MAPKPKPKPSPSQPQISHPIEDLFASLNGHIQNSNFRLAVKLADQVLVHAPGDEDAIRCKVVALLKDDLIDDALTVIRGARNLPVDFRFYEAYCLYRLNKLDEALDCLKNQEQDASDMLLESQILYRQGKMDLSANIYQKLQKAKIDSLEINAVASLIAAGRSSEVQATLDALRVRATNSFELAYNTACSLIEREKFADAEQLLLSARRIGQETLLEENLEADEVEKELAPIAVQLAYVQQSFGRSPEAMEAYTSIISHNLADEASLAVSISNLVSLKGSKDASDSLRKLDRLKETDSQNLQHALELKLLRKQKEAIHKNRVLLLIHANKLDQAREVVALLLESYPESITPVLLQAAVFVRENKAGKAEEILWQFAEKHPEGAKTILLARAQIAAAAGHHLVAAESVSKIPDIQHMPATVATLVALRERAGDVDGAAAVLDSAIKWWSNAMTENNHLSVIMQEAAAFRVRHGKQEDAACLYEELVKSHGSIEALVGLVTTTARVDIVKAESYEKQLKPLPGLKAINVDNLEKTSGAKQDDAGPRSRMAEALDESKSKEKPKKKRKRKPRYPKGFDPKNPGPPPDPERWLPKRERSSYRPKRKDKRAAQVRGSQGAVARDKHEASAAGTINGPNPKPGQLSGSKGVAQDQPKPSSKSSRKKSRN